MYDNRAQVMTRWPADYPQWDSFPYSDTTTTTWVNDDDHSKTTSVAAGPIQPCITALVNAKFVPDVAIGGTGGTTVYSGSATGSLIDAAAALIQTVTVSGGGSTIIGNQNTLPDGTTPNYAHTQIAQINGNAVVTGTPRITANGQTTVTVPQSDADLTGGIAHFSQFIAYQTTTTEPMATCRIIPLSLSP